MDDTKQTGITFPVPKLYKGQSPVNVDSVILYKSDDTKAMMRIDISRDLSIRVESFTFKYRFSSLPFSEPDSRHSWHSFVYTDPDMNEKPILTFRGNVPSKMKLEGCTAYVSEVRLADGTILTYPLSNFVDRLPEDDFADLEQLVKSQPVADVSNTASIRRQPEPVIVKKPKRVSTGKLTVFLTLLFFSIIIETIAGVYIYNYTDAKRAANLLMSENRYNEAYKLVLDKGYKGLLQKVCERASDYYIGEKDLEESYVYASAAPNKFTDKIIDQAAGDVVDKATGEINENAYRVAKMASDDGKFSEIVHSMISLLENKEDFPNALRVASELRGENDRTRSETTIFTNAVRFYLSEHKFEGFISFINELENVRSFSVTDSEVADAIKSYAKQSGDSSGLIYFSTRYPDLIDLSSTEITIKPDDSGIHSALPVIWDLLTTEQKRIYLSRSVALSKELFVINDGKIDGTQITDAVSVATGEFHSIVLHKNGSVSLLTDRYDLGEKLPGYTDVIGIAAGKKHSVILRENGTVEAFGDNSKGQCEVAGWNDIVMIAAGDDFTLGLRKDGTLVACGSDSAGQCQVSEYHNVASIAAGGQTSVILFTDGTVRLAGYRSYGLAKAENASDVISVRAGGTTVVVKKKSGRFELYDGSAYGDPGNVENFQNIFDFAVGITSVAALGDDGRLYTTGSSVPRTDIVQS